MNGHYSERAFIQSNFFKDSRLHWDFLSDISHEEEWTLICRQYERWLLRDRGGESEIPRDVHQIWIGSKVPRRYRQWRESWLRHNPSFNYHLWSESEILDLGLENEGAFRAASNAGVKSDIARYEILRRFGGIYADTDFECLRPLDDLMAGSDFIAGLIFSRSPQIANGLIMSSPGHGILEAVVKKIKANSARLDSPNLSYEQIFEITGPYAFTASILSWLPNGNEEVGLLPSNFFYPWPNFLLHHPSERYSFCTSNSYAIHHWQVSWAKRSRLMRAVSAAYQVFKR